MRLFFLLSIQYNVMYNVKYNEYLISYMLDGSILLHTLFGYMYWTIERWLDSEPALRNVVYKPAPPTPLVPNPKNVLIQWQPPQVIEREKYNFL